MDEILLKELDDYFTCDKISESQMKELMESNNQIVQILNELFEDYSMDKEIYLDFLNKLNCKNSTIKVILYYLKNNGYKIIDNECDNYLYNPLSILVNKSREVDEFTVNEEKESFKKLFQLIKENKSKDEINAQKKFIASHYYLLVIKKCNEIKELNIDKLDIYQYGIIALYDLIDRFDINKKTRFSTFLYLYLNHFILRIIDSNERPITYSFDMNSKISEYNKFINVYLIKYGIKPSKQEIAEKLNITENKVYEIEKAISIKNISSLDIKIGEDEDSSLLDFVKDYKVDIEEEYIKKEEKNELHEAVLNISGTSKNEKILTLICKYGLDFDSPIFLNINKKTLVIFTPNFDKKNLISFIENLKLDKSKLEFNKLIDLGDINLLILNRTLLNREISKILKVGNSTVNYFYKQALENLKKTYKPTL